jgi:2'-5' RNA ligase
LRVTTRSESNSLKQLELNLADQFEFPFARNDSSKPPSGGGPPSSRSRRRDDSKVPANLFLALFPDPGTATRIGKLAAGLRSANGLTGNPLANERFHVTVHFFGQFDEIPVEIVRRARAVSASVALDSKAFPVTFGRAGSFTGKRDRFPLVLRDHGDDNAPLVELHRRLGAGLRADGIKNLASRLTPHVTLLYDRQLVSEQPVEAVRWTATEVFLIHSHVGQSRYTILDRWSLQPATSAGSD